MLSESKPISKPSNIRALADLRGTRPLIQLFRAPKTPNISVDMHYVRLLNATGLNLFMSAMRKTISAVKNRTVEIVMPADESVSARVSTFIQSDLEVLSQQISLLTPTAPAMNPIRESNRRSKIFEIRNEGAHYRAQSLTRFRNALKAFLQVSQGDLNRQQMVLIFSEIVKNTLDHSDRDASLGLDIEVSESGRAVVQFSYCEQGVGLSRALRASLKDMPAYLSRAQKGGFSDLIHWALQPGNSTKSGNGVNFGLGMGMILAAANGIGLTVELIDASSIASLVGLSEQHSHLELRRRFVTCSNFPCFAYVGELSHG